MNASLLASGYFAARGAQEHRSRGNLAVAWRPSSRSVAAVTTLWHVIDLLWVVILPIVYLG
jgi:heme/copper-type cytochrome/quinol oxidase subunit 3